MCYYIRVSLIVSFLLLLPVGCKRSNIPAVPVSGRVTLDKQPLANATVHFQPGNRGTGPNSMPDAVGRTDSQGYYQLKAIVPGADAQGAVAGQYEVQISVYDRSKQSNCERIPARYNAESKLTFTVPERGTKQANFDLTSN